MTGRKKTLAQKSQKITRPRQVSQQQIQTADDSVSSNAETIPSNIKKEQPPPIQTIKKIIKTENDEARTLKTVFKSNPDSQMKEFIKKAQRPVSNAKPVNKTPADNHSPAVVQELLDTDDDVADNLAKLFKASKSYKN